MTLFLTMNVPPEILGWLVDACHPIPPVIDDDQSITVME
jgi:hypothetical protein